MDKKLFIKYSFAIVAATVTVMGLLNDLGKLKKMFKELTAISTTEDSQEEW